MIIQQKMRDIVASLADDNPLKLAIGARMFLSEAPQGKDPATVPYIVFYMAEDRIMHQNSGLSRTRPWMAYLYAHAKTAIQASQIASLAKTAFCRYKETATGAADTDIQAITLDTGLVDLEKDPLTSLYPCSIVLKVTEQIGA